jgi:hypothetical protein
MRSNTGRLQLGAHGVGVVTGRRPVEREVPLLGEQLLQAPERGGSDRPGDLRRRSGRDACGGDVDARGQVNGQIAVERRAP